MNTKRCIDLTGFFCSWTIVTILASTASIGAAEFHELRPNLTGRVLSEEGVPVNKASVFIYTAGPRQGSSPFCPSCYPDCRKRGRTQNDGAFKIEAVDPQLLFRLLIVGRGFKPVFVPRVDPFKGPVDARLGKLSHESLGPKNQLMGRVVSPSGQPVANAVVSFEFFFGDEANCGGQCDGVDPMAVSDEDGQFLITTIKRFDWMTVTVEAQGFAKRKFFKLPSGSPHELRLTDGATVTGRVLNGGQPTPDITIGLVSVDRSESFTGDFNVITDKDGRFAFFNIPPYQVYYVYGLMDSLRKLGALPVKKVRVSADGSTKQLGDLTIEPGRSVTGRVLLSDRGAIPPGTRILLGRDDAWDTAMIELKPDGSFEFRNVPAGAVSLSVSLPGYLFSEKNRSLDKLNGGTLIGQLSDDVAGLEILLEPGHFNPPDFNSVRGLPEDNLPRNRRLQGAESPLF